MELIGAAFSGLDSADTPQEAAGAFTNGFVSRLTMNGFLLINELTGFFVLHASRRGAHFHPTKTP
jgi:hypothetical protein